MRAQDAWACLTALGALWLSPSHGIPTRTDELFSGYSKCPKPKEGVVNLHLVPHTHDDVGWLKTVDQYYYGTYNRIQDAGVQYILDSVIVALLENPERRFIYVETAFFWKWWNQQTEELQGKVKLLVNRGQLEFIGGAWSMNDEATTHYQSIIDQFTWGFRRLEDTFGPAGRPRAGWQIDPFGHSRQNADIMAKLGFDALFLGRIDWEDKVIRLKKKTMEMVWHTSQNDESENSKLFTGVMYNTYSHPKNFCFDVNCHDEPIIDDPESPDYNAKNRTTEFLQLMKNYGSGYKTNNIIVTMGDDFVYMNALMNFKNMDKLIEQINRLHGDQYHAFYSTPTCYAKAVHDTDQSFPNKTDDFFPYSSDPTAFWTGYFTSRPTIKRMERVGNNLLQICKQLHALSGLGEDGVADLTAMREAMGVMQHHDAVTGTEKQHVARDYARLLDKAMKRCEGVASNALSSLMKAQKPLKMESCHLLNISSCPITEKEDSFVVTLYNPLSWSISPLVTLPISDVSHAYSIKCPMGKEHNYQLGPIPKAIFGIPGRKSDAMVQLHFVAPEIPPLGFKSFYVTKRVGEEPQNSKHAPLQGGTPEFKLAKHFVARSGDNDRQEKSYHTVTADFAYYESAIGDNENFENRSSGAYIFRPEGPIKTLPTPKVDTYQGPVLVESHFVYNDWVSAVIRSYESLPLTTEIQWIVGPIPIEDKVGKEVVIRIKVKDMNNDGVFRTDSNGKEMLERRLNYRPSWDVDLLEPVPGNYYPVTTRISIGDDESTFSVITDRAQGGSSLENGTIELMVHRRMLHDDAFGVGEALNETAYGKGLVAVGSHFLAFTTEADARVLTQQTVLQPWLFFSPTNGMTFDEWKESYVMFGAPLSGSLPQNVQILTLEQWRHPDVYILRLEHFFEKNEDAKLSKPTTVQLSGLFAQWEIIKATEMMLAADVPITENNRFTWKEEGVDDKQEPQVKYTDLDDSMTVTLNPMEIKTFLITMHPRKSVVVNNDL